MPIPWRSSAEVFAQILQRHGVDPDAVTDVEAAWRAFGEFLQVEVDGIDAVDVDADGFIVQWGRYSWNNKRLSLSFTRQLAVADSGGRDDPCLQPEYWQIDLQMCFNDEPELLGLDSLYIQDSGFSFDPIGPERTAELAEVRAEMERYPQLRGGRGASAGSCQDAPAAAVAAGCWSGAGGAGLPAAPGRSARTGSSAGRGDVAAQ